MHARIDFSASRKAGKRLGEVRSQQRGRRISTLTVHTDATVDSCGHPRESQQRAGARIRRSCDSPAVSSTTDHGFTAAMDSDAGGGLHDTVFARRCKNTNTSTG
jgi:hypothetical protein